MPWLQLAHRRALVDHQQRLNRSQPAECPTVDTLRAFAEFRLSPTARQIIVEHLESCRPCSILFSEIRANAETQRLRPPITSQPEMEPTIPSPVTETSPAVFASPSRPQAPITRPPPSRSVRPPPFVPPDEFDGFCILRPLGRGTMGQVYLAREKALGRLVSLKFIAQDTPDKRAFDRFLVEARAIARLQHPNVVSIFRIGEIQGRPYLAYEFVNGEGLDSIAKPVTWEMALRIALGLARGLSAAHAAGVLHRDIKPANAVLATSGETKLLDFGIAKLVDAQATQQTVNNPALAHLKHLDSASFHISDTAAAADTITADTFDPGDTFSTGNSAAPGILTESQAIIGTPLYLAPEIWAGSSATARSDIYAFGLVLYELCTGRHPHAGLSLRILIRHVREVDIPKLRSACPNIPEMLCDIIDRCVRRDPDERFASADHLRLAVEHADAFFRALELVRSGSLHLPKSAPKSVPNPSGTPEGKSTNPLISDTDIGLVEASLARVVSRAELLVSRFYDILFERNPLVRRLFPSAMEQQRMKLAAALSLLIENLRTPSRLTFIAEDLGRRHAAFPVEPEHFRPVGQALIEALAELEGPAWTPALEQAWLGAYGAIADSMKKGLREGQKHHNREPQSVPAVSQRLGPATRYAQMHHVSIAYQTLGDSPSDFILVPGWITHLEVGWTSPILARFLRKIAAQHRLLFFDKRGTGMSDRELGDTSLEARMGDLSAVMDDAPSERAVLMGCGASAAMCALFAATYPERVRALILFGSSARTLSSFDYPYGLMPDSIERSCEAIRKSWGSPLFLERNAPSVAGDASFRRFWGTYLRMGGSPSAAIALLRANAAIDVREHLGRIQVPTLVLHRIGDQAVSIHAGRDMASRIPNAQFVSLPGEDHLAFVGDTDIMFNEIKYFIETIESPHASSGIVQSTRGHDEIKSGSEPRVGKNGTKT